VLVEAPAAEHASHFQTLDGTKSVLGVDANLVFSPAHNGRLPAPSAGWPGWGPSRLSKSPGDRRVAASMDWPYTTH
jgi:hypothetical protein